MCECVCIYIYFGGCVWGVYICVYVTIYIYLCIMMNGYIFIYVCV